LEFNFLWGGSVACEWDVCYFLQLQLAPDHHIQIYLSCAPAFLLFWDGWFLSLTTNNLTWMQIRLNGSNFASFLQLFRAVSGPKNLVDPLQGLPRGKNTKQTHKTG
jgi:hypothetical protein